VARRLASLPPAGLQGAKEAMTRGHDLPLEEGLRVEAGIAARVAAMAR
jgi:enoyl-CoA hydratase/carnithine racemase